jgi:hypothetical protein
VAAPTAYQNQALGIAQGGALEGSPTQIAQNNALLGVAGGQFNVNPSANPLYGATTQVGTNPFIGNNPQLQAMIAASNKNITDAYSNTTAPQLAAQFAQGGAFGGSAYGQAV